MVSSASSRVSAALTADTAVINVIVDSNINDKRLIIFKKFFKQFCVAFLIISFNGGISFLASKTISATVSRCQ